MDKAWIPIVEEILEASLGFSSAELNRNDWPLTHELLQALRSSDPHTVHLVENQARIAVGLPTFFASEGFASGTDVVATFDAMNQRAAGDARAIGTPIGVSNLDDDQEFAEPLRTLAHQLQTMSPTQRQAMVAKLRMLGETSLWVGTHQKKTPEQLGEQTIDQDSRATLKSKKVSK